MEPDSTHHHTSFGDTSHHTMDTQNHHHHTPFEHSIHHGIPPESTHHHQHSTFMDSSSSSSNRREHKTIFPSQALQLFMTTVAQLDPAERTKAKELFMRNVISEYRAAKKTHKNSYFTMALHLLIPIFWPMLFGALRGNKIELEEAKIRIQNALDVWKNDLGAATHRELTGMLNAEP